MAFQMNYVDPSEMIMRNIMGGQQIGQNFRMNPLLVEQQKLSNALNEYKKQYEGQRASLYPQLIQAELAKAQAEPGQIRAHTSALGAQAGLHSAEAREKNLRLKYMQDLLSNPSAQNQPMGGSAQGGGFGGGMAPNMDGEASGFGEGGGFGGMPNQGMMPQESVYGIPTPTPTREDIKNKMFLGIDTFSPRRDNAKAQQEDQYKQYQEAIGNSLKAANGAASFNQAMGVFNNAMDRSTYKGSFLGTLPSSGILTAGMGNVSPEQEADRAAMNMLPAAIETLKDSMGQARFSNLDMGMAAKMKFDRTMTDEARELQTQWIGAVNHRMQEKSKFLSVVGNPQSGLTKNQAEQLWQSYQEDLPLINEKGNKVMNSSLDKWWFYTTPKAIESLKNTGSYHISKEELNTVPMRLPDNRIVPIKKSDFSKAYNFGARPL